MSNCLQHFSHNHPLQFTIWQYSVKINCRLCHLSIDDGQSYICHECSYIIHKACAELPNYIHHSLHPHHSPLRLDKRSPKLPLKIQHPFHLHHPLTLQCDACRKSYKKWNINVVPEEVNRNQFFLFRCMECDFNLHFLCGPLPLRIKYDYHIHPLNLVDHVVTEDDSNEYYCDICEDERKQDFRIYYCEDCKYTAHIHCLMSEIMKVIKENSKDVELMALGENLWYQFGAEKEMSNENEVTLKEVMNSLTREEKEILIDPYALVYPLSIKTQMEEDHSFYCRENSPLFDHELPSTEDIEKINQFPRFGESDASNFFLELRVYRPKEGLKLDEKYLRQKVVDVQGHIVPVTVAPILKTLLHKHGSDLFCGLLTREMKSVIATLLCVVIDRIYNTNIEDVTRDDIKEWVFCLKSIENITAVDVLNLVNFFQTVIVPVFLGFEAIRYEKDISEKLDLMIKNLEANLERCKEARRIFKTETCMRPDRVKDIMVSDALRWKGTKVNETASHAWKISG
ncbi:C1-like [Trema orientale]|uniref:C1-like n=1 Tax=Trema orientale TaxID=63057 RepID=A0A2P5FJY3_TREOI|nr:C1-like [Trema orientale]